jgi:chromosome partitioning protein
MKIITVYGGKGGIGKTGTCLNFGYLAATQGRRTLLVDFDSQCDLTSAALGPELEFEFNAATIFENKNFKLKHAIHPASIGEGEIVDNLWVVPGSSEIDIKGAFNVRKSQREYSLKKALEPLKDEFDYVFVDCPPTRSEIPVNGLAAADLVICPIELDQYAEEAVIRTIELTKEMQDIDTFEELMESGVIKFFLSKYDPRTRLVNATVDKLLEDIKPQLIPTPQRLRSNVKKAGMRRLPIVRFSNNSEEAQDIINIFNELGL